MPDQIDARYTFAEYQEKAITDVHFTISELIDELVPYVPPTLNDPAYHGNPEFMNACFPNNLLPKAESLKHICNVLFLAVGLAEEAGEVAGKIKKIVRNNRGIFTEENIEPISKECGDVLWYLTALIKELGLNLDMIAYENYKKLQVRKENGTICSSGDNR